MKKIVYAITRIGKKENLKMSGLGYITDKDIIIACNSPKDNKAYIRIFEDILQYCYKVPNTKDTFKGAYTEFKEVEFTDSKGSTVTREVEVDYLIWYKLAD